MIRQQYTRRRVLATVATAGGLGALAGGGVRAFHTDREQLPARLAADALDLAVCLDDGDGCQSVDPGVIDLAIDLDERPAGTTHIEVSLPTDRQNMPAYVWLRTDCPTGSCGIERALATTIRTAPGCDGTSDPDGVVLASGSLCEVRSALGPGTLLDPTPLVPGETICLDVAWDLGDVCVDDTVTVTVELFAHQAAHSGGPVRPWTRQCETPCPEEADCDCPSPSGISFVAFCVPDGVVLTPDDISFEWTDNVEGEPVAIDWTSMVDLSTVVLYYGTPAGPRFENFDGGTSGFAAVGAGETPVEAVTPETTNGQRPETTNGQRAETTNGQPPESTDGQTPANPAPDGETGLKYEFEDGEFRLDGGDAA